MLDLVPNLIFLFHVIRASENLLVQAAKQAAAQADGTLQRYYQRHLEEERGHAQWLAEDLKTAGVDVKDTRIPREAVELVGSVYYLIFHADPCALLGYMRLLESWPLPEEKIQALEAQHSPELLRTARHHATHDPAHLEELERVISTLAPERLDLVQETEAASRDYLVRALRQFVNPGAPQ